MRAWMATAVAAAGLAGGCRAETATPSAPATPPAGAGIVAAESTEGAKMKTIVEHRSGDWTPALSDAEKTTLFALARQTLEWALKGAKGEFPIEKRDLTAKLKEPCAVFVTYKNGDDLRGCIGVLEAMEPMCQAVHRYAIEAARDYRFAGAPITLAEMPKLNIHVSLLSPMRPIASLDEFKLGEHGIVLQKGFRHAVFLPEVAIEQKWTKEETLAYLSRKAGLSTDAWREGAKFKVFSSVVLAEE
jgi:AmmeMemoRadiSam system protein A